MPAHPVVAVRPNGSSIRYVETYTLTRTSGGASILPKYFSQALAGGGTDASVSACARAAYGPAGSTGTTIPLIMTRCEYDLAMKNSKLVPAPPYTPTPNTGTPKPTVPAFDGTYGEYVRSIESHDKNTDDATLCGKKANGQTYPGGFSWVIPSGSDCSAEFDASGNLAGNSGASPPQPQCKQDGPREVSRDRSVHPDCH